MGWFENLKNPKLKAPKKLGPGPQNGDRTAQADGSWKKCTSCAEIIQTDKLQLNLNVCPYCHHHYRLSAKERINQLLDTGTFEEWCQHLESIDPLSFQDKMPYKLRLESSYKKSQMKDATICGKGKIFGMELSLAVMDFSFMGGSMGVVTGEKITVAMEKAVELEIPMLMITCSGGARMQEGILSLMQMAKTSAARQKMREKGLPYISLMTDPTTGGCAASFAMQGDVNLTEPKALIGFAGPRVIEQTIRQKLPEGFQTAEFLKKQGFVDAIIARKDLRVELAFYLKMFSKS